MLQNLPAGNLAWNRQPINGARRGADGAISRNRSSGFRRRRQLEDDAIVLVGEQVQVAVGTLAHVADALIEVLDQPLLADDLAVLDVEARKIPEFSEPTKRSPRQSGKASPV